MLFVSRDSMLHPTIDGIEAFSKGSIYTAEYVNDIFNLSKNESDFFVSFEICANMETAQSVADWINEA